MDSLPLDVHTAAGANKANYQMHMFNPNMNQNQQMNRGLPSLNFGLNDGASPDRNAKNGASNRAAG